MKRFLFVALCVFALASLCCSGASAQSGPQNFQGGPNASPCDGELSFAAAWPEAAAILRGNSFGFSFNQVQTSGLQPVDFGFIVYDSNSGVCWLADANLAGNAEVRALLGVPGINPDGTMDYPTAVLWVDALNHFAGRGFLGHRNWQLPANPLNDGSCSAANNGGFGISCTGSALGNLYNVGLARKFPNTVVGLFTNTVWPMRNLQPGLYWASDTGSGTSGQQTLSFNTDIPGSNTTVFNYFHVLPMVQGAIATFVAPPGACGVFPYTSGSAAGKAVIDTCTGNSWTLDANLAATENFGVVGRTSIPRDGNVPVGPALKAPLVDADGTMLLATAYVVNAPPVPSVPGPWFVGMNENNYAGSSAWQMPAVADLQTLFSDLGLQPGDGRLESQSFVGPFWHLQPYFYWACEPTDPNANAQAPCNYSLFPSLGMGMLHTPLEWSFDFDNGFQGTDLAGPAGQNVESKQFYVMVNYAASTPAH